MTFKLESQQKQAIKDRAKVEKRSRSDLIRDALCQYLQKPILIAYYGSILPTNT
ncbi:CopG family ribbon-helix-helix protein [Xenococcus sp. PCC 7305]|uniref:CopG family ribbon-helix-helix protein n=1 Tax=Xenococcus sp. PCC 7305 TaxID=102125 RepID=UPI003510C0DF